MCSHQRRTAGRVLSLKYGCPRTHDVRPGIVQFCCLFTFLFINKQNFDEHVLYSLTDKVMKFQGSGVNFEQVTNVYRIVWATSHQRDVSLWWHKLPLYTHHSDGASCDVFTSCQARVSRSAQF